MNNWRRVTAILLAAVTVSSTMNSIPMNRMEVLAADNKIELAGYNTGAKDIKCKYLDDNTDPSAVAEGEVYKKYLLTANEGDSREWGNYLNEVEVKINGEKVVTLDTADYDGLNPEATYLFGGRSFSIYNAETMEQVYDNGSDFEEKTAKYLPEYFNCSNDKISMDNRSGKKGPEPESVVAGTVGNKSYAFVGLERIGGVMVYDITDPAKAVFVNYINSRDFSDKIAGDVSPEGLVFVSAAQSFSGNAELLVANEVSGTVAIYELKGLITASDKEETVEIEDNENSTDIVKTGDDWFNNYNKKARIEL